MGPVISDIQEYKIVYRRWVLLIPALIIVFGIILLLFDGTFSTAVSIIGYLLILIGILTLGVLLAIIFAITLSAKTIANTDSSRASFREKLETEEVALQKNTKNEG